MGNKVKRNPLPINDEKAPGAFGITKYVTILVLLRFNCGEGGKSEREGVIDEEELKKTCKALKQRLFVITIYKISENRKDLII